MNHMHRFASPLLLLPLTGLCCGTETDNPVVGSNGPAYESPIWAGPAPEPPPGCPPSLEEVPSRRLSLAGISGTWQVVASARDGLTVRAASPQAAPNVLGSLALSGYPRQLLLEGTVATLVLDEWPLQSRLPVVDPATLATQTRLLRIDLSDPANPKRLADTAVPGEFWELLKVGDSYWVASARLDPSSRRCDAPQNLCGYVDRQAMVFERYEWDGSNYVRREGLELPAGERVWLTPQGFATASYEGVLSFSRLGDDGHAEPVQSFILTDPSAGTGASAPRVSGGSPLFLRQDGIVVALDSGLMVYGDDGSVVGQVRTSIAPGSVRLGPELALFTDAASKTAMIVGLADPSSPTVTTVPQAEQLLPLPGATSADADLPLAPPSRLLGWKADPSGSNVTLTLWTLENATATLLDSLQTELAVTDAGSVRAEGSQVRVSQPPPAAEVAIRWDQDELTVSDIPDSRDTTEYVLDFVPVGGGEAVLFGTPRGERGLRVLRAGSSASIGVSPAAERLLPAGDRLLVLSTQPKSQCVQSGAQCDGYVPNVAVATLDPLRISVELPLPDAAVPGLSALSQVDQQWSARPEYGPGPVQFADGSWMLQSQLTERCMTVADCQALGIVSVPIAEANVNLATPAPCPPEGTPCSTAELPAATVYGTAHRRMLVVVNAAAESLGAPLLVDSDPGVYSLWSGARLSHDTVIGLRLATAPSPPGMPPTLAGFFLQRYQLNSARALEALPEVNIPGYPIALLDDGGLLSVEASGDEASAAASSSAMNSLPDGRSGSVTAHRLQLLAPPMVGATIEGSLPLPAAYGDARVVNETGLYLQRSADRCNPGTRLMTFQLDSQLTELSHLEIPGDGWSILGTSGAQLILVSSDSRDFARITVSTDGALSASAFLTAPSPLASASWQGGVLYGIGNGVPVKLDL